MDVNAKAGRDGKPTTRSCQSISEDKVLGFCRNFGTGTRKQQVHRAAFMRRAGETAWRELLIAGIFRLLFTHHMDQLDATQDHSGTVSGLEAEHRTHTAFDGAVILLNVVIEIYSKSHPWLKRVPLQLLT